MHGYFTVSFVALPRFNSFVNNWNILFFNLNKKLYKTFILQSKEKKNTSSTIFLISESELHIIIDSRKVFTISKNMKITIFRDPPQILSQTFNNVHSLIVPAKQDVYHFSNIIGLSKTWYCSIWLKKKLSTFFCIPSLQLTYTKLNLPLWVRTVWYL